LHLDKYGVSIVKIGGVAFRRYAKIFCRRQPPEISTRIAIVTDCDVKTEKLNDRSIDSKDEKTASEIKRLKEAHDYGPIRTYVAPHWTFEYSIAMSCLGPLLHKAILEAKKISNSDGSPLTPEKLVEVEREIAADPDARCTGHQLAYHLYNTLMLEGGVSKAITAQCLAAELRKSFVVGRELEGDEMFDADLFQLQIDETKRNDLKTQIESDSNLEYIVEAIKYVTGAGGR
jgi:putative ATP-dependent endonuclease of OLD family